MSQLLHRNTDASKLQHPTILDNTLLNVAILEELHWHEIKALKDF